MAGYTDSFGSQLDALIGAPDTAASHQFYAAWAKAEGGGAAFNPFNTTQIAPGSTHYNTFGPGGQYHVENYADQASGLAATAHTLEQSNMAPILNALRAGSSPQVDAQAVGQTHWGTSTSGILGALGTPGGGASAQTVGFPNPLNIPGDVAGGLAHAFGSLPNPLNIPGDVAGAVGNAIKDVLGAILSPLEKYLEDAALVIFGLILTIVGLIMLSKAAGNSGGAPAAAPAAGGGGGKDDGEEGGDAAEDAVLA